MAFGFGGRAAARRSLIRVVPPPGPVQAGVTAPDFADLSLTPAFAYHPHTATVSKSGVQITGVTGTLGASPGLTAPTTGPDEVTYANGLKAWRFEGADCLELPTSFTSTPQAMTVFLVGRQHASNNVNYFGHSYQSDGATVANTLGGLLSTTGSGGVLATLKSGSRNTNASTGKEYMAVGCQPSVFGVASRATANGACRFFVGSRFADTVATNATLQNCQGGRIGGYLNAGGTTNNFDLQYIVCFTGELTNAQAAAVSARLMSHFGIADFTRQIVLDGDSITQGIVEVTSGSSLGMVMTEPGAGLLPADVRVLNMANSGSSVSNLVTRRDIANGWPIALLPGGSANNLLAAQIGRNDVSSFTAAQIRDNIVSYNTAAGIGVFARGFDVRWAVNIANGSMTVLGPLRDLIRDASFVSLHDAQAGGANAGRLGIIDLPLIEQPAGTRRLDTVANANDATYYQVGDTTHPSKTGTALMASGGATPQHGYGGVW